MTLQYVDFPLPTAGVNIVKATYELDDHEARIIQDLLFDKANYARMRGKLTGISGFTTTFNPCGIAWTTNPRGTTVVGIPNGDDSNGFFTTFKYVNGVVTEFGDLFWAYNLPTDPYSIVDTKPALTGGVMVGISSRYDSVDTTQALAWWRGGVNIDNTATITVTQGATTVTDVAANWSVDCSPGTWLFADTDDGGIKVLIGCVESITSNTALVLVDASPYDCTATAATLKALRGIVPRVATGLITCDTSSSVIRGGGTKFKDQELDTGIWNIYRRSDMSFIGLVDSVTTNISLVLNANAAQALFDEPYVAINQLQGDTFVNVFTNLGFLTAAWNDRQWFVNNGHHNNTTSQATYSEIGDPEAVDTTHDGNTIDVSSSEGVYEPTLAVTPTYNALVFTKETETWAIFGSTPDQFEVRKLWDDGTICGMSVVPYGEGCIWTGLKGIHYFDGSSVTNITENKLGMDWLDMLSEFDINTNRAYGMVSDGRYTVFIEGIKDIDRIHGPLNGKIVLSVDLTTGAISTFTNLHLRGAIKLPPHSDVDPQTLFVVTEDIGDDTQGVVCNSREVFVDEASGEDIIKCNGMLNRNSPAPFYSTKMYPLGDTMNPMKVRNITHDYLWVGDSGDVTLTTYTSLDESGEDTINIPVQEEFLPYKARFDRRGKFFAYTLEALNVDSFSFGPARVGYKPLRSGRT